MIVRIIHGRRAVVKKNFSDLEECCRFFADLCTPTELRSLEQRFDVAVYLQQGLVYLDILDKTMPLPCNGRTRSALLGPLAFPRTTQEMKFQTHSRAPRTNRELSDQLDLRPTLSPSTFLGALLDAP